MRLSRSFTPTLRDDPAEADVASHRLLLRAAFVRQVAAGIYTTLPMGLRTMRRIEQIIREEMDASGAIEIRMPIAIPAEPWKATGRWDLYGDQLFRLQDRHGRDMLLGPTQEEVVTPLIAGDVTSYRDLPLNRVPGGVEVPRRVPTAIRAAPWTRVPDEGRLLLRPRRGGPARVLPGDVRGVPARVRPVPARLRGRRGGGGADRRGPQPRVHGASHGGRGHCTSSARTATTSRT